jgi:transcriptional regulator with XRE-family HTH domain
MLTTDSQARVCLARVHGDVSGRRLSISANPNGDEERTDVSTWFPAHSAFADVIGHSTYAYALASELAFLVSRSLEASKGCASMDQDEESDTESNLPFPCMIGERVIEDRLFHRLSRELLHARVREGLLQAHVAKRMHTTTSAVSRLENASGHRPTLSTLERYATAVGCTLRIRLVHRDEAWYRHLSTLAGQNVGEPHEVGD